jgi:hypothetical protein
MKVHTLLPVVAALAALTLAGCFGKEDESPSASCSQSSMEGTWKGSCRQEGGSTYKINTLTVSSANSFAYSEQAYTDSSCGTTSGSPSIAYGIFTIGGCGSISGTNVITIVPASGSNVGCGVDTPQVTVYKNDGTNLYFGNGGGGGSSCTAPTGLDTDPMVKQP